MHKHKVNETKKRSLTKALIGRVLEISIGTLTFGTILSFLGFPYAYQLGLSLNLLEEIICALITYLSERVWNRVNWGREVWDIEE